MSPEKRETRNSPRTLETRRSERSANSGRSVDGVIGINRRSLRKRKSENAESPVERRKRQQRAQTESDSESEENDTPLTRSASWRQVRKDGGRLRKCTRNSTAAISRPTRRSPRLSPEEPLSGHSISLPVLPAITNNSVRTSARSAKLNNSFPSAASGNPFQNVSLRPTPSKGHSAGSIDSISHELGGMADWPSPFSALLTNTREAQSPPTLTLRAGSVWSRISARANQTSAPQREPASTQASPTAGPSGTRMATRASPLLPAAAYPAHSTPRVPSLTLTGQFVQSGRFAFLLESLLQVTVVTDDITMATTSAIVITTDGHLQHSNPVAQSVERLAGSEFARAREDFLRRNRRGLQACEVLDTPAGGQLPPLISHVLHVVVPEAETTGAGAGQRRKMLLCTYVNCLKHASEKLGLSSLGTPLIGAGNYSADECIQVFFDSMLVYLAERTPSSPLHAVQLMIANPALARFSAEVLEARLQALKTTSIDVETAAVFKEYFNVPDFSRGGSSASQGGSVERSPSGKPAVKRRRL